MEIYSTLLPAYFPRNIEEDSDQVGLLPGGGVDLTDEWGARVHGDRAIPVALGTIGRGTNTNSNSNSTHAVGGSSGEGEEVAPSSMYRSSASYNKPFKHGHALPTVPPNTTTNTRNTANTTNNTNNSTNPSVESVPVLVPAMNPQSKYANRHSTGDGKLSSIGWPMPKAMTAVVSDLSSRTRKFRGSNNVANSNGNSSSAAIPAINPDDLLPEPERLAKLYDTWVCIYVYVYV